MEKLRHEVGVKESFRRKLVRNQFKVGCTCGTNGRETVDEECGCAKSLG